MRKSCKREYEYKRSYDFCDYWTPDGKRFNKKRAHKRLRSIIKNTVRKETPIMI